MAYGLQGYGGPGLGGGLAILLGIGLLALLFMGFSRVFLGRPWAMQGGPQGGRTATSSRGSAWRRRTRNVPLATGGMARPGVGTRLTRSNQRQASRGQAAQPPPRIPGNHPRITPAQACGPASPTRRLCAFGVFMIQDRSAERSMNETILVIDDEPKIVKLARDYLERGGFRVVTAAEGTTALAQARHERPDLIVLDLNLPGMDGLDVCRALRRTSDVPIIMLTARTDETDRLIGLELGADDYIVKPFSPRELVARIRAVLRRVRGGVQPPEVLRVDDLEIDLNAHRVTRSGEPISLTPIEFRLLAALAQNPGATFTRDQLVERLHGVAYEGFDRSVDSHVKNLRRKLEPDPAEPRYVLTVYGVGYRLNDEMCIVTHKPGWEPPEGGWPSPWGPWGRGGDSSRWTARPRAVGAASRAPLSALCRDLRLHRAAGVGQHGSAGIPADAPGRRRRTYRRPGVGRRVWALAGAADPCPGVSRAGVPADRHATGRGHVRRGRGRERRPERARPGPRSG